ncbi:hypothetical protein AB7Y49_02505 [Providencia vermicola]|uniref:hypothetical protein n=1 Tax=Providencia TaxID=586 RepID=UPI0032DAA3F8
MKERKPLFVNSAPFLDENFNQVSVDLATARRKANEMERKTRKLNWGKNAIGFVFEADTHFNVSVGFECRALN